MVDDINDRVGADETLLRLIEGVNSEKLSDALFNDPSVQDVLKKIISSAVDAAMYMRG